METPTLEAYESAKADCGDCLMLFRFGDFYEAFHDDARSEDRALLASGHRPQVGPSADPGPEASAEGDPTSPPVSSDLLLA